MNIRTTLGSGRVVKRRLFDGSFSFTFSVVRNMRINGRPSHFELAKIGTFRQSEFTAIGGKFWAICEKELSKLVKTNKLWNNDADKIRRQFSAVIPIPAPAVSK
jgi:hypothetical protein